MTLYHNICDLKYILRNTTRATRAQLYHIHSLTTNSSRLVIP